MSRFEQSLKDVEAQLIARLEAELPVIRQNLIQTGCAPDRLEEEIAAYRRLSMESIAEAITKARRQAEAFGWNPERRPISEARH